MSWETRKKALREGRPLANVLSGDQRKGRKSRLLQRDGARCFYCQAEMGKDITLEHLTDWQFGGSNEMDNLVLAHRSCNARVQGWTKEKKLLLSVAQTHPDCWRDAQPTSEAA